MALTITIHSTPRDIQGSSRSAASPSTMMSTEWPLFHAAIAVTRECLPAANGSLPHATRSISDFLDTLGRNGVFAASIERGDTERELSYLYQRDPTPLSQMMIRHAAALGHTHVLKWIKEHEDQSVKDLWSAYNFNPMDEAAKGGHVNVMQWLHENLRDCYSGRAMSWAASNGHLEAMKWLLSNRQDLCVNYAIDFAAVNGHLSVVKWLHINCQEGCTTWAMDGAATNGHLEVVQWLHSTRKESCTKAAIDGAAANGHADVVHFILQVVRPIDEMQWIGWAFTAAVEHGQVEVAKWVKTAHPDALSDSAITLALSSATDNGHQEMMRWLSSQQNERR